VVLGRQAALWVDGLVDDVDAPGGRQCASALPGAEHGVDDGKHCHVLEDAAVAALREKHRPRFDRQRVARKAAVRTVHGHLGDVAVEGAQRIAAGGGQTFKTDRTMMKLTREDN